MNHWKYSLFLEWNCLGIWDSGIKSIAESLSINESLETLDLRNNKIGPQSAQNLALCLKHNNSLKKLGKYSPIYFYQKNVRSALE